ncbi:hypothetical protein BOO92_19575 [Vibrio navarrensis]|uniref:hypothetical protein n=1 Tax=Vibrio TaxID=662 RepID=UPI0018678D43|nr:hypothetical protein [Vibrio navarrensis]MBE3658874.1 hypothetical protein [Vibrio navarrensis]
MTLKLISDGSFKPNVVLNLQHIYAAGSILFIIVLLYPYSKVLKGMWLIVPMICVAFLVCLTLVNMAVAMRRIRRTKYHHYLSQFEVARLERELRSIEHVPTKREISNFLYEDADFN